MLKNQSSVAEAVKAFGDSHAALAVNELAFALLQLTVPTSATAVDGFYYTEHRPEAFAFLLQEKHGQIAMQKAVPKKSASKKKGDKTRSKAELAQTLMAQTCRSVCDAGPRDRCGLGMNFSVQYMVLCMLATLTL